jgi:hypothetical protein
MCVEQQIFETAGKSFTLLLHYSPSSSRHGRCYPALFLGGWEHVFLDSVGNDSSAFDVDKFIALACRDVDADEASYVLDNNSNSVLESIRALLPRVIPYVASRKLFYRDQNTQVLSFGHQKARLDKLMLTHVGDLTIGDILCEKFSALWLESALLLTTRRASDALLRGTTQLSLSMSIHSVLVQFFQAFLCDVLAQSNEWKNLDLVEERSTAAAKLFGLVLRGLPVRPFEELVLQRRHSTSTWLVPLPSNRVGSSEAQFPFFRFISTYNDEVVESAHDTLHRVERADARDEVTMKECFQTAFHAIEESGLPVSGIDADIELKKERRKLVRSVIAFVQDNTNESKQAHSLFDRYLCQFIEWKVGCVANSAMLQWWSTRLQECGGGHGNILSIHVVARVEQMNLMKMASIIALSDSCATIAEGITHGQDICEVLLNSVECAVMERRSQSTQWSIVLSAASDSKLAFGGCIEDEYLACRLRRLSIFFMHESIGSKRSADWLLETVEKHSKSDYSLSRFQSSDMPTELLLQRFLSPIWLQTTRVFLSDDLNYLVQSLTNGTLSNRRHSVGLLRSASRGDKPHAFGGLSVTALLQINENITAENLAQFSADGDRRCLPHFIPQWLRGNSNGDGRNEQSACAQSKTFPSFFAEYKHCFDGELSHAVFELLLSTFAAEAENLTSEQL